MSRAFRNRAGFAYVIPDDKAREDALTWLFGSFMARLTQQCGEIYVTPDMSGGALWIRPGGGITYLEAWRAGALGMPFHLGIGGFKRCLHLNREVEKVKYQSLVEPHWYLMALGVEPDRQGEGIGTALMQPVLRRADVRRLPCYLETFTEENLGFYRRVGFEVRGEGTLTPEGPRFWGMGREPKR